MNLLPAQALENELVSIKARCLLRYNKDDFFIDQAKVK